MNDLAILLFIVVMFSGLVNIKMVSSYHTGSSEYYYLSLYYLLNAFKHF